MVYFYFDKIILAACVCLHSGSELTISASALKRNLSIAEDNPPVEEPREELSMYSISIVENCP